MEAMASGKPVIASRIGGIVDLDDEDETGLLVGPGDSLALREAMERLLANPDMRKRMGQVALYKVVDFQASTIVPRIEFVYEELLLKANLSQKTALRGDSVGATRT